MQIEKCLENKTLLGHVEEESDIIKWNKVLVVGLGQVGLPVAKYVKQKGFDAYGFDINQKATDKAKIAGIKQASDLDGFGVYILCVPTHRVDNIFKPQTESLFSVVRKIGREASKGALISIESTVPRGTSRRVFGLVKHRLHVAHVPHRWYASEQELHGVNQLRVAGGVCDCCLRMAAKFYNGRNGDIEVGVSGTNPTNGKNHCGALSVSCDNFQHRSDVYRREAFNSQNGTRSTTDMNRVLSYASKTIKGSDRTGPIFPSLGIPLHTVPEIEISEVTKFVENAHRFLQIAFAEDLYLYCHASNINFPELRDALNSKWNVEILEPRNGIGGHCLPKDTRIFLQSSKFTKSKILTAAMKVDQEYRRVREDNNRGCYLKTKATNN